MSCGFGHALTLSAELGSSPRRLPHRRMVVNELEPSMSCETVGVAGVISLIWVYVSRSRSRSRILKDSGFLFPGEQRLLEMSELGSTRASYLSHWDVNVTQSASHSRYSRQRTTCPKHMGRERKDHQLTVVKTIPRLSSISGGSTCRLEARTLYG